MNVPLKNRWIILALILFFPLGLILMWLKSNWSIKAKWIVTGVFGAIVVLSAIGNTTSPSASTSVTTASSQRNSAQPTKAQATPTEIPTIAPQGLGVSRAYLINKFQQAAKAGGLGTIDFTQGAAVNGQDNYTAQAGQNLIQLIGPADNLTEVSSTALIDSANSTTADNLKALIFVFGLGNMIDPNAGNWITNTIKSEANSGQDNAKQSTVINGRKYELDMGMIGNVQSYTLTVDPSQQ